ncbi:tRNA (adenosine(37)-N6)-threonylcarbamoyltransferase complex dimerization subunit type 1 TsaB [Sphingomicrobium sediminis]|uniref:tRNA (Adenosine(37)-N6)-threonylcarbamoyltransferase complex dimerization subunit type 1 TsaB n=1 Tax=Sphingomicrobium sediminis TaxID=2950949 RepID=A0A9X2EEZ5_9SPHN|nr:tRNA (adenosine(37)-N6)-threonylcarbamoyltransferase complex dimerization subunit type 1 TsaB [Sphingomicrobium sediminis]MCM8556312.1 tRNA (adenosine(37)-N6)-threonylcarbamoyltransferase complex dimerization subunit type 1 TsaB [Sphingomicrobium sediminis]
MILAIETSTAMCSAALFANGDIVDARAVKIGRGHAERLVPIIEELLGDHVPTEILVSVGPGSFTGIRVGIAAAQGLAIGWHVPVHGFSSMTLMAAAARRDAKTAGDITVAMQGGHGELFVQGFEGRHPHPIGDAESLPPADAASKHARPIITGPAAAALADAGCQGSEVIVSDPVAADAILLTQELRRLPPAPLYVRPPDAKPKAA